MNRSTKVIIGLLLIGVLAAGGVGWLRLANRTGDTQSQRQTAALSSSATPNAKVDDANTPTPVNDEYLVISEWGVKFKLPDAMRGDIYYAIEDDQNIPGMSVNLISRRLENQIPRCINGLIDKGSAYNGFASVTRQAEGDGIVLAENNPPALVIRGQYGYFNRGTYCAEDPALTASDKANMNELIDAFKKTLTDI